MRRYNAAYLIKSVQNYFSESQENAGALVLNAIVTSCGLNIHVDSRMVSNVARGLPIHSDISNTATMKTSFPKVNDYVLSNFVNNRTDIVINGLCSDLLSCMKEDTSFPPNTFSDISTLLSEKNYSEFITTSILSALTRDNSPLSSQISNLDSALMLETGHKCPLCGKQLTQKKKGQFFYNYKTVNIFPRNLDKNLIPNFNKIKPAPRDLESINNKIALCKSCADSYEAIPSSEEYSMLVKRKESFEKNFSILDLRNRSQLTDEIAAVISSIAAISRTSKIIKFSGALTLDKKILPQNRLLRVNVEDHVVRFYPFIEKQFSLLDGIPGNSFNVIQAEVNTYYEKLEGSGLGQPEIYDEITTWMMEKTNLEASYRMACQIVVSFFIQNCSVFKQHITQNKKKVGK